MNTINLKKYINLKLFCIGLLFGAILFTVPFFDLVHLGRFDSILIKLLFQILYIPVWITIPLGDIIHMIDIFFESDIDIGLGFDGGPLEWLEWLVFFVAMGLWYGILFSVFGNIYTKIFHSKN